MSNSSIWPREGSISGATSLGHSGHGSNNNEGMLRIPQHSSITEVSPWDCLVSYPGFSLRGFYPSLEMQSMYSIARADWASKDFVHLGKYRLIRNRVVDVRMCWLSLQVVRSYVKLIPIDIGLS